MKFSKRIVSLLMCTALSVGCAIPAMAMDKTAIDATAITDNTVATPRSTRTYNVDVTSVHQTLFEDDNWDIWGDDTATITFLSTQGPTKVYGVIEYYKDNAWHAVAAGTQTVGGTWTGYIGAGSKVRFKGYAVEGRSAPCKFSLALSH